MNTITVDAGTRDKLLTVTDQAMLRDEAGHVIGRFIREEPQVTAIPDHGLTEEELARRMAPGAKTYTTAEVLAHLRDLS